MRLNLTRDDIAIERMVKVIWRAGQYLSPGLLTRLRGHPVSAARVDVIGIRNGQRVTLHYALADRIARMTAVPAAEAALMILQGAIQRSGVLPPEAAVDPDALLSVLAQRGIVIHESRHQLHDDLSAP